MSESVLTKYDIHAYQAPDINIPTFKGMKGIILIVGSSGSGKSTILRGHGLPEHIPVDETISILENFKSEEEGERLLISMGLRSIPTWTRKITEVSNGERHRAECAIALSKGINCIDEFTSVVDRDTAKSLSASLRKYYKSDEPLYVATCHRDVEEWLCPDHIYDTDTSAFNDRRSLRRPDIELKISATTVEDWVYFKNHHYLDASMSKAVHCYVATINDKKVGFLSVIHGTGRDIKTYWRECRLVVLPEFQGLGIGRTLSEEIAKEYVSRGKRYFSKTAHPALGEQRDKSDDWRGTSTNHKSRPSYIKKDGTMMGSKSFSFGFNADRIKRDTGRVCYSHEYIGKDLGV